MPGLTACNTLSSGNSRVGSQRTSRFLRVLGVHGFAGRRFASGEDAAGKNHVAILSYGFWQRHFGGRRQCYWKNGYLERGVLHRPPASCRTGSTSRQRDLWTPLDMSPKELGPRGNHNRNAIARLNTAVTHVGTTNQGLLACSKLCGRRHESAQHVMSCELSRC